MNKRKRALPLSVLVVGLLVVLAGIGIVAGLWSKNLVINGTVETGDVNIDWVDPQGNSDGPPLSVDNDCTAPGGPWSNPNYPCDYPDKDVAWLDCFIDEEDQQILHFEIHNGYPSYEADCEVHFRNTGSIPVNFTGYGIVPGSDLTGCGPLTTESAGELLLECDQLTIWYLDGFVGGQLDPGLPGSGSLLVHVEQPAEQSECTASGDSLNDSWFLDGQTLICTSTVSYDFSVKFCFSQWNEDASLVDCVDSPQHEGPPGPGDGDGEPYWIDEDDDNDCVDDVDDPDPFDPDVPTVGGECGDG